jgi:hypothetical protein
MRCLSLSPTVSLTVYLPHSSTPSWHRVSRRLAWKASKAGRQEEQEGDDSRPSLFTKFSRTLSGPIQAFTQSTFLPRSATFNNGGGASPMSRTSFSAAALQKKFRNRIKVYMYNFGSPRVGNGNFKSFYDKTVPNSYRVVVDGDIVVALPPPTRYSHIG